MIGKTTKTIEGLCLEVANQNHSFERRLLYGLKEWSLLLYCFSSSRAIVCQSFPFAVQLKDSPMELSNSCEKTVGCSPGCSGVWLECTGAGSLLESTVLSFARQIAIAMVSRPHQMKEK